MLNDLARWREEFPILDHTTYLISNSLGAMPRGVYGRLEEYAETWATRGVRAWEEGWLELSSRIASRLQTLLGVDSGTISLHQNVTLTQAVIASCFDFTPPRNKVVMVDLEFPSILYFYREQERRGARIEMVASEDGIRAPLDRLLSSIDEHTLLVPVSYVLFRSAAVQDARAIIERAHRCGAHVVLDVYQAAGVMPLNLSALDVDFAVGGVLKWLCGGPGVAYLYVRPDLAPKLRPALTGWMAHDRPFDFESGRVRLTRGPFRFLSGTPLVAPLYAAEPGLEIVAQVGVERIRERSLALTDRLMRGARERGWRVNTPERRDERGGTVSIDCPNGQEVTRELLARDILVDYRPNAGIRLSPHFYNREDEVDRALDAIAQTLAARPWAKQSATV